MIEINEWLFVQMINFFILLFVLNRILYKPVLQNIEKRQDTIRGYLSEVENMEQKRNELLGQIDKDIAEARIKARKKFEELRNIGLTRQKALIHEGEQTVQEMNERMFKELHKEKDKAKASIMDMIQIFGNEIVKKMISPS